ncbi:MAG TPA: tetratricopeptide repeat protein [Chitinophagaceae bacterium]
MMRIKTVLFTVILIFGYREYLCAQNSAQAIDSLLGVLKSTKADTNRVNVLNDLSFRVNASGDFESARRYADSALSLSGQLNFKKGIAKSYRSIGIVHNSAGKFPEALKNFQASLRTAEEAGDNLLVADSYNSIGYVYRSQANHTEALKNHLESLKIREAIGDKRGSVTTFTAIGVIQQNQGKYDDAIKSYQAAIKIAEEVGDKRGMAGALNNIGYVNQNRGNYQEAIKNHTASLKIAEEIGDKRSIANSLGNLGNIHQIQGNYAESLKNHRTSLKLKEEIGDKRGMGSSLITIGVINDNQGNYAEGIRNYFAALKIFNEIRDKRGIAGTQLNIGIVYEKQGNDDEALKYYLASLKAFQEIGDKRGISLAYYNTGGVYQRQKNYAEALNNLEASLKIREELGDKSGYAASLGSIGVVYQHQGKYNEAMRNFQASLKISEEIKEKEVMADRNVDIGNTLYKQAATESNKTITQQKLAESIAYLNKGYQMAREIGIPEIAKRAYGGLTEAYRGMNDYKKALEYHTLYATLSDSLVNNETMRKIEQQRRQYEIDKAVEEEKNQKDKALIELRFQNEKKAAEENARHQLALAEEQSRNEKAIEIERLNYNFALASEKSEQERKLAEQRFESEKKLASENALHQRTIAEQKATQEKKEAAAKVALEKERAERKRKNELLLTGFGAFLIVTLFTMLFVRQRSQKKRAIEKAQTLHKMAELELQSLRAQLNPHFMFNSLNAIQDLIVNGDNERSHLYLSRFAKLLRMLLDNANRPFVSVKQELEFLELYLSLENLRIPDLRFSIEKDPGINTEERMIPNMMLQPYIENAIWHGLSHKKGNRNLQVRIHENGMFTEFEIEDNGIGRKRSTELKDRFRKGHHSKGMELLSKRFSLMSKEYGASIQTIVTDLYDNGDAAGTLVKIDVPFSLSTQAKQLAHDTNHHN